MDPKRARKLLVWLIVGIAFVLLTVLIAGPPTRFSPGAG